LSQVWSSQDVPVPERRDYVLHRMGETIAPFDPRPADEDGGFGLRGPVRFADIGAVRLVEIHADCEAHRTTNLIRSSDPELCKIDLQLGGRSVLEQHGRQASLEPGDFAFVDLAQPCRLNLPSSRHAVVIFPRALLPIKRRDTDKLTGVTFSGADSRSTLVSSIVRATTRNLDDYEGAHGARVGSAILDLITDTLAARLGENGVMTREKQQRTLLLRIRAYMEERLGDPDLAPATIAGAHHISTRYLHRLFEPQGTTVATWLRSRRLARCRQDLLNPALSHATVSGIGARWGFADPASFSRAFRNEYGVPPSEYRRQNDYGGAAQVTESQ
jgi:AraC-like DNA-binding protein